MSASCSLCSASFEVTDDDVDHLHIVAPTYGEHRCDIPTPTLCPHCRTQRRMAWRNDRTFYKRKCDLTGKEFISMYPMKTPFPVYRPSAWYSDGWDPLSYGKELDLGRPFLEQWQELMMVVPRLGIDIVNCENSEYCNYCGDDKDCYLDIAGEANEDCFYDLFTKYSTDCVDCTFVYQSTLCYECIQCYDSYACRNSMYLENCSDCAFSYDLKGCKNCLLSINLRNKEYFILNQPHTKQEYEKKLSELRLGSSSALRNVFAIWKKMRIEKGIYRDMYNLNCDNCSGNDIKNSKNCQWCFNISNCEDCAYLYDVLDAADCQDLNYSLYKPEASYELISTLQMRFSAFCMASHYCSKSFYCDQCNNAHDLFGCIGLNHKEYCILNKQYSKEEYEELVPRLIAHMRSTEEWGEFFPAKRAPHGYNETVAHEYMPMTKETAQKKGFLWRDEETKEVKEQSIAIPDDIKDVPDTIASAALVCEESGKNFKIIEQELAFYRSQNIPLPRRSPDQRHRDRMQLRNPRWLWQRTCKKCEKNISTSYQPLRPEQVYCEQCYLKELP